MDRESCRRAAAECVEMARITSDPLKREVLLIRAQEWIKLAYAHNEAEFERHVAELNDAQMTPVQRAPVQQQPQQQQQQKKTEDEK